MSFLRKELSSSEINSIFNTLSGIGNGVPSHLVSVYETLITTLKQRCEILQDTTVIGYIEKSYYFYLEHTKECSLQNKAKHLSKKNISKKEKFIKNIKIDPAFIIVNALLQSKKDILRHKEEQKVLYIEKIQKLEESILDDSLRQYNHLQEKIHKHISKTSSKYGNYYQNITKKYIKKIKISGNTSSILSNFSIEYTQSIEKLIKRLQKEYNKEQKEIQQQAEKEAKGAERKEKYKILALDVGEELAKHITKYPLSPEEVGLRYEQYIGYLYEKEECEVIYNGATQGKKDGGRDLIVKIRKTTFIVQCKNYSKSHDVHENTVNQLNTVYQKYAKKHPIEEVFPVLITTHNNLDEEASDSLKMFNIEHKVIPMSYDYPMIKCNINKTTGKNIYHLPTDGQYNRIKIRIKQGNFYCWKPSVAESNGFIRTLV